jgi:hypothetical protein
MGQPDTTVIMRPTDRLVRIVLPDGVGMVEIQTGIHIGDDPRIRVDVTSDQPRYGATAKDGRAYRVENSQAAEGVVYLTGFEPEPEPDREAIEREAAYKRANGLIP